MQKNWSNCTRVANVCRVRKVCEKNEPVEMIVIFFGGQSLPANDEKADGVWVDMSCGEVCGVVSTAEIIVLVDALLEP